MQIAPAAAAANRRYHLSDVLNSVLRDHPLLVGGDDIDTDTARLRCDRHLSGAIGVLVENDAQPGAALADARGEHEAVQAAQGSYERADLARGAEYEQVQRFMRVRISAGEQRAHVA